MEKAFIKAISLLQNMKRLKLINGYALTGGVAMSFYVSYRTTFDIDFCVDTSLENFRKIYEEYLIISKLVRGEEQDLLDIEIIKKEAGVNAGLLKKIKAKIKKI